MNKVFLSLQLIIITTICPVVAKHSDKKSKIKSIGIPLMTTYGPSDYKFSNQNFAVLVGDDQRVYFGNDQGILVYDGNNWVQLTLPNGGAVYGLAKGEDGTIYVGAVNDIGYLKSGANGKLEYISLHEKLGWDNAESYIGMARAKGEHISFSTDTKIMIFDPLTERFNVLSTPGNGYSIYINDTSIYSYSSDSLFQLQGVQWKGIRRSIFANEMQPGSALMVDLNERGIIITRDGFFDFETEKEITIPRKTKEFINSSTTLYNVSLLHEKYIVLSTWSGLLITDLFGEPIQFLNKAKGLPDDFLFGSAIDGAGLLWVATNNGIAKIDLFSPVTIFDERMDINHIISDIKLHKGYLYISTPSGVYRDEWSDLKEVFVQPTFERISSEISSRFLETDNSLIMLTELSPSLVLENETLNELDGTANQIFWTGFKYRNSEDLLLGSLKGKLLHLSKKQGVWKIKKETDPSFLTAQYMAQGNGDDIWVSNLNEGVFKLEYDKQNATIKSDKKYGKLDGLPSDKGNYTYTVFRKPCFATSKGIYKYDSITDRFLPNPQFSGVIGESPVSLITNDPKGNVYYFSEELNVLSKTDSGYIKSALTNIDFLKYSPICLTAIDPANVIIGSLNAFLHVDPSQIHSSSKFQVNLSSVISLNSDSTYFHGFGPVPKKLHFTAVENAIRFGFSAAYYQNIDDIVYKWRLKGLDEKWSDWSSQTSKGYTNLAHGDYVFEVIAKNIFSTESAPTAINFRILTPWYFTIWAYLLYAIAILMLIRIVVKFYTRKLIADRTRLEHIVQDRTLEITHQKEQVESYAEKLEQMDELKKRFFVNISHELRTPLTLSMGTIDQALQGAYGQLNDELYANLKVSKRNNQRLMKMVNSILDISKLEGGKIQLYATLTDPYKIIRKVLAFFSSRLAHKKITLTETLIKGVELYLDEDKFETVLINLLSNAFKFTPDGGSISISMEDEENHITITICDSGKGIPNQDLAFVFDRFYQSPGVKSGEGIGVGLALSRELVELHGGVITARNRKGAVFTLTFLKGKDHFAPNQIVEPGQNQPPTSLEDKYPLHDDIKPFFSRVNMSSENLAHILLVEDNPEMSQFVSGILKPYYRVSQVSDGAQALDFLENEKPDLIVTDYLMPNMDGYEMAVEIKRSGKMAFIPIVFLTARAREQDKLNVLNLGVDDYLFKPFSTPELLVRIKNLLNIKKLRVDFVREESIGPQDIEWTDFASKLKLKIDEFISVHIKNEITAEQLAEHTNQSERTLYRKIKANTGLSVMGYVREYRLRKARTMLENQEMPTVSEISYAIGFNYLSHFTKSYKERFGKQPSEYLD